MKRCTLALGAAALLIGGLAFAALRLRGPGPMPPPSASTAIADPGPGAVAVSIYDGKLGAGWEDWGWGPHELPKNGPARVVFSGFGGIVFRHAELPPDFGGLVFHYKAPKAFEDFLSVTLLQQGAAPGTFPNVPVEDKDAKELADGWRKVWLPWRVLNPKRQAFDRVQIGARHAVDKEWVELDKVALTQRSAAEKVTAGPARNATLSVDCAGKTYPISPLIYGITHGAWPTGATGQRIGGNPLTRYNWDLNFWNTGSDWFFLNTKVEGNLAEWVDSGRSRNAYTALVVPTIGWVAKDGTSVGFPVSKLGPQRKTDPHRTEAGDGYRADGAPVRPGPPTQTSVEATPEVIGRWITRLREWDAKAGRRGVQTYILDNEPSIWDVTHRDVHPDPVTYDELLDRTIRYGTAIRKADAEGLIAGPAEWGWSGYFYSAKDRAEGFFLHPDRRAHGGIPLIPWYLQKLAEHEKTTGVRVLDVLDVHFYPAAERVFGNDPRTDAEGAALRIRSTRALWDSDYLDESWIKERVRLIPRMKEWIAANYPGRKLMIGEWSFGADEHISGGIATAEALGRFGQHGLDMAFYWGGPREGTATFWAFRAFRNFDGKGARFLDLGLPARGAESLSLFASRNEDRSSLVAIVLNLDGTLAANAEIELKGCPAPAKQRVFSYQAGATGFVEQKPASDGEGAVRETLPPYSINVIELSFAK